jgi:hypothetical protein
MALTKCKECGNEVSKSAKTCPKCGAKLKNSVFAKVLYGLLGFFVFAMLLDTVTTYFASKSSDFNSTSKAKTERKTISYCQAAAETDAELFNVKPHLKNPDSYKFSNFEWTYEKKGGTEDNRTIGGILTYRATNSFNAIVPSQVYYEFELTPDDCKVTKVKYKNK